MTEEWKRGWPVVAGVAGAGATGAMLHVYVGSLFIPGLTAELGFTRGELAAAGALAGFGVLAAPLVGAAADRFGVKIVASLSALALAALYLALTLATSLNEYRAILILFGVVVLGTTSLVWGRVIAQWFEKSRGLALGLATSGISATAILVPPLAYALISAYGWRAGYYLLAGLAVFVCLPLILLLVTERPGSRTGTGTGVVLEEAAGFNAPLGTRLTRTAILWRRDTWLLALAIFCLNMGGSGILSQLAVLLTDRGVDGALAASAISLYAIALIVGRLGGGFLLDRLPSELVACTFSLMPAIGCTMLLMHGLPLPAIAVAVFFAGLQQGSETDVMAYFTARQFGTINFGTVYGIGAIPALLGHLFSSVMFGFTHDRTGSYDAALLAATVFFVLGAGALLALGPKGANAAEGPAPP